MKSAQKLKNMNKLKLRLAYFRIHAII